MIYCIYILVSTPQQILLLKKHDMDKKLTLQLDSYTDAAGKFKSSAPRQGNEDSSLLLVSSESVPGYTAYVNGGAPDGTTTVGDDGVVMVVADGMGGMNAGEVASAIAIDVAAKAFDDNRRTCANDAAARGRMLEDIICRADAAVKADASHNGEHAGMGSTMIMAWLVGNELTVTWIGDSRAYLYRPGTGIRPLSRDHSYVQELANRGVLTYEETFGHPQGNIVTRSLGDPSQAARPETAQFTVGDGDIIMLCSDGLSGVLRDRPVDPDAETPTLETVIAANAQDTAACGRALMSAAREADWYDNVTVMLCRVCSGAGVPSADGVGKTLETATTVASSKSHKEAAKGKTPRRRYVLSVIIFAIFFVAGAAVAIYIKSDKGAEAAQSKPVPTKTSPAKPVPTPSDTAAVQHVRGKQAMAVQNTVQSTPMQTRPATGHTESREAKPAQPQKVQQPGNKESQAVQDKIRRHTPSRQDLPTEKAKTEDKAKTDRKAKADPKQDAKPGANPLHESGKDKENKQNNKI